MERVERERERERNKDRQTEEHLHQQTHEIQTERQSEHRERSNEDFQPPDITYLERGHITSTIPLSTLHLFNNCISHPL